MTSSYTRRAGRRTSTYSDQGQGCVAVDFLGEAEMSDAALVEVTHSKIPDSPAIFFTPEQWAAWQDEVETGKLSGTNGCVTVEVSDNSWRVSSSDGTELVFNEVEWTAFQQGIANQEFETRGVFSRS